ncbi:MAG: hypothetical protein WBD93_07550 [Acidobacteriaceae bacterium]
MPFTRPVVLIHGYSDKRQSFEGWRQALIALGAQPLMVNVCTYISLNNEVTITDIGEALDRALEYQLNWKDGESREFDAIVHSTGMLVLRSWLVNYGPRRGRLKHLVGLAPATFGSPLAHKGRSLLGSIFKGNHDLLSPDFLNAGDRVLDGLELGSSFTWELSHKDLLADPPFYTSGDDSPWVAVFVGDTPYTGIREVINEPGTDGTVRWAGAGLNTRKVTVDLRRISAGTGRQTVSMSPWANGRLDIPIIGVPGANHATILADAGATTVGDVSLAQLVGDFLQNVITEDTFTAWLEKTRTFGSGALQTMDAAGDSGARGWQQFVVHAVDENGDPITDYSVTLCSDPTGQPGAVLQEFEADVHPYRADPSFRCFHVNLPRAVLPAEPGAEPPATEPTLYIRLNASTGTPLLQYQPYDGSGKPIPVDRKNGDVLLDIANLAGDNNRLFYPYTTTLIEIRVNRETLPLDAVSGLLYFLDDKGNPPSQGSGGWLSRLFQSADAPGP